MRFEERIAIDRRICGNPDGCDDLGDGGRIRMYEYHCRCGNAQDGFYSEESPADYMVCESCGNKAVRLDA